MTIEPAVLIGFIAAILGLLGLVLRLFLNGELLSRHVVRREAFDQQLNIVDSYAAKFGDQTEAVRGLAQTVGALTERIDRHTLTIERLHHTVDEREETIERLLAEVAAGLPVHSPPTRRRSSRA